MAPPALPEVAAPEQPGQTGPVEVVQALPVSRTASAGALADLLPSALGLGLFVVGLRGAVRRRS